MSDLLAHQRLEQGHLIHARAQRRAQSLSRVGFCRPRGAELVELVAALAADVTHAVVPFVVLLVALLARVVQRQCCELADSGGDKSTVDDAVALGGCGGGGAAVAAACVTVGGAAPCRVGGVWQAIGPRQGAGEGVWCVTTGAAVAHIVFTIGATGISGGSGGGCGGGGGGGGYSSSSSSSSSLSSGWRACGTHNISVSPCARQRKVREEDVLR